MSDDLATRINQLEEALAHHEVLVHDLSDEMAKQWQTIEAMARRIKELEEKIASQIPAGEAPQSGEPPPPHY